MLFSKLTTKKLTIAFLIGFLSFQYFGLSDLAYANDGKKRSSVLFVSPHRVSMSPKQRVQILNVSNHSDIARRYDLKVIDQIMLEDGTTKIVKNAKYSAKPILRFVPKRFTLQPGERQVIRIMARRGKNLPDGDYHSHLLFKEVPLRNQEADSLMSGAAKSGQVAFEIKAVYGVAVPIVVQKGKIESSININSAELIKNDDGKYTILLDTTRTGNAEASGFLSAKHIVAGKEAVDIIPKQWFRMYREVDHMKKTIRVILPKDYKLEGGKIVLTLIDDPKSKSPKVMSQLEIPVP